MVRPSILILHASGTNRDGEAARACELAGGAPEIVHINRLRAGERRFVDYAALLLPGGFTYGDALGAGARLALDLQVYFQDELTAFAESWRPVLGICNGFQTLVKAGLLPGPPCREPGRMMAEGRRVTLTENAAGHFECRWVHLAVEPGTRAGWLRDLGGLDDLIFCPIAHGEGNVQVMDDATLAELERGGHVVFRYVDAQGTRAGGRYPVNPNGSVADIAGLCNAAGNVAGLMPHPEDHLLPIQNPLGRADRSGLALFTRFVEAARHA
jgi:phosphoribosylformylglycinamidine synthase